MSEIGRAIVEQRVPRGTFDKLAAFVELLSSESLRQNLVSRATLEAVWHRHILDSLQLLALAEDAGHWIDIGSGAGLPGLVVAIASERAVTLIEPRRRRAEFLVSAARKLDLTSRVTVLSQRCETSHPGQAAVVSARAVGGLEQLFAMGAHFADRSTIWVLPKGRSAADEVAIAKRTWQGDFRLVPSLTETGSSIVVARDIRRRGKA